MERADAALKEVLRRGIDCEVSLIYGLPLQTYERFCASVQWCLERGVPRVQAWPLMLLRGTPLHAQRAAWGFEESGGPIPHVVASHTFTRRDHERMAEVATWLREHPGATTLPAELRPTATA